VATGQMRPHLDVQIAPSPAETPGYARRDRYRYRDRADGH
jgi:hypothetical protein